MRETKYVKSLGLVVIILLITSAPIMAEALSGPQKNAVRSAENYLRSKSFSRSGLIEQLSSEYGDSYRASDATLAVDSLGVDWNKQAVRAAKEYLNFPVFLAKGSLNSSRQAPVMGTPRVKQDTVPSEAVLASRPTRTYRPTCDKCCTEGMRGDCQYPI